METDASMMCKVGFEGKNFCGSRSFLSLGSSKVLMEQFPLRVVLSNKLTFIELPTVRTRFGNNFANPENVRR